MCRFSQVALLAEGVDRNTNLLDRLTEITQSPSSRRAWIEMGKSKGGERLRTVALLAEGVDRNVAAAASSLAAAAVALLAEGVDRNLLALP